MYYSLIIYTLLKLYLILNIYQQSHYQFKLYSKHFLTNLLFYDVFPIAVFIVGYYNQALIIQIICSIYLSLFSIFYLLTRIKLKFTKRMIRLSILSIIYIAIILIPYVGPYLCLLFEWSIIPLLALERVISKLLNHKYLKRTHLKLANYQGSVIGITGSYGKTSTKVLLTQALNLFYLAKATQKSYNTELGIAKFINEIVDLNAFEYLVLEFGASHKKDIKKLQKIVVPQVVFVTEIGYMHIDTFNNIENIINEKMSILNGAKIAVLNYDNAFIRNYSKPDNIQIISYGLENGDYQAKNIQNQQFDFYHKNHFIMNVKTNLVGNHQILNLLGVLAYLFELQVDKDILRRGILGFKQEKNRLELKKIQDRYLLDDSFNSNYKGFVEALNVLKMHNGKRILLTPGMVELGRYKKELLTNLKDYIIASADIIILIGYYQTKYLFKYLNEYNKEVYVVRNFMEGYSLYLEITKKEKNSMVLIENDLPDLYRVGLI